MSPGHYLAVFGIGLWIGRAPLVLSEIVSDFIAWTVSLTVGVAALGVVVWHGVIR